MRDKDLTNVYIAGSAILFFTAILPIVDSVVNLFTSAINKTITSWQLDMQLEQAEAEAASEMISPSPCNTQAIGFQVPNEAVEDEYE